MCKNLKKLLEITVLLSFLSCPLPLFAESYIVSSQATQETMIMVSGNQWTSLKRELGEQETELATLRMKLKNLGLNSIEQKRTLESLQNRLSETEKHLMSANVSLSEAKNELKISMQSLGTLKNQINELEHKQKVLKRQRNVYMVLAGVLGVYGLVH